MLVGLFAVQVLQQLHGLAGHDDLFEHGLQEGHHSVLAVAAAAPAGLVASRAPARSVTQPLLTAVHSL